ncbi:hypothetical protein AAF712_015189 [Marasmius tenuissimus]|uniref:Uncharacterized protein n=1 Tax=Marasmius tenuissimus TaxID=585030 RepID=A0ABR2ZA94_9AGAR
MSWWPPFVIPVDLLITVHLLAPSVPQKIPIWQIMYLVVKNHPIRPDLFSRIEPVELAIKMLLIRMVGLPPEKLSLEDLCPVKGHLNLRFQVPRDFLSAEQTRAVHLAEAKLTPSQRNAIKLRNEMVTNRQHDDESDSSETQSESSDSGSDIASGRIPAELKHKGKAVEGDEPNNLSDIEVDMAAQRAAYEKFYNEHHSVGSSKKNTRMNNPAGNDHPEDRDPEDQGPSKRAPKVKAAAKKAKAPRWEPSSESSSEADDESDKVPKTGKKRASSVLKSKKKGTYHQPMTPFFDKRLKDVVHGKSAPSSSRHHKEYSIEPAGQLPDSNNLGRLFNKRSDHNKHGRSKSKEAKKKRNGRKRKEASLPSSGGRSSDSLSSPSDNSLSSESSSSDTESTTTSCNSTFSTPSETSSSPDDSLSTTSSSDHSSLSDSSSSLESGREKRRRKCQSEWKDKDLSKRKRKDRKKRKQADRLIKPIPPTKYNGAANQELFETFVMEGTQFVKEGHVPKDEQAILLSHYLTEKGHKFFLYKVARNH